MFGEGYIILLLHLIHLPVLPTNSSPIYHDKHTWTNGYKCNILAQSQCIFSMHHAAIEIDYCTKYELNQPFLFRNITTNTLNLLKKLPKLLKFGMGPNAILHASATHGNWLLYQIWIKSTYSSLRYQSKHTKCMKKWL